MRYEIRHISLRSTLRFSVVVGLLLAALPGLLLGWLAVSAVQRVRDLFARLENVNLATPDVTVAGFELELPDIPLDVVELLGLNATATSVSQLADGALFLGVLLASIALGTLLVALPLLAFALCYNLLAPLAGGFQVDVKQVASVLPPGREDSKD